MADKARGGVSLGVYLVLLIALLGFALTVVIALYVGRQGQQSLPELQQSILGVGALAAVALSLVGWVAAYWIIRPLKALRNVAHAMAEGGVRPAHAGTTTYREAARLDAEIVRMSDNYEQALLLSQQRAADDHSTKDRLTGLPTRQVFIDRLSEAIARTQRSRRPLAVLFLDINRFKAINDSLGHAGGDDVLLRFAALLARSVRKTDIVTRIGADQFVILAEEFTGGDGDAVIVSEKIITALRREPAINEHVGQVSTSIGIAIQHGADENTAEELVARAERAMKESKGIAGGGWAHA